MANAMVGKMAHPQTHSLIPQGFIRTYVCETFTW